MGDVMTCPRRDLDTGETCGRPLPDGAFYGPCPACAADVAARHADALFWRCARVAQALDDGCTINETGDFVRPAVDEPEEEVIAGDRAGAPARARS